jgi:hypothetical protein
MDGRQLLTLLDASYLLSLAVWFTVLLLAARSLIHHVRHQSAGILPSPSARSSLPRLLSCATFAGTLGLASFTSGVLVMPELRGLRSFLQIAAILFGLLASLYCVQTLLPAIERGLIQDTPDLPRDRHVAFRMLIVLLVSASILVFLVIAYATRPPALGTGLVDPPLGDQTGRMRGGPSWV